MACASKRSAVEKVLEARVQTERDHPCEDTADTVAWKSPMAATVKDDATQALATC